MQGSLFQISNIYYYMRVLSVRDGSLINSQHGDK